MEDFERSIEKVIAGVERTRKIDPEDERTVAYHESGHAVVGWLLKGANPLLKLTIVPRSKGALGFAQYLPKESQLTSREEFMDQIATVLAG